MTPLISASSPPLTLELCNNPVIYAIPTTMNQHQERYLLVALGAIITSPEPTSSSSITATHNTGIGIRLTRSLVP
ncbi:MAG: hypothetical protein NTU44_15930 [Bacteroidetes bacterium]|nr:hypothetical protein [Bacteroidota bacterium]